MTGWQTKWVTPWNTGLFWKLKVSHPTVILFVSWNPSVHFFVISSPLLDPVLSRFCRHLIGCLTVNFLDILSHMPRSLSRYLLWTIYFALCRSFSEEFSRFLWALHCNFSRYFVGVLTVNFLDILCDSHVEFSRYFVGFLAANFLDILSGISLWKILVFYQSGSEVSAIVSRTPHVELSRNFFGHLQKSLLWKYGCILSDTNKLM